MFQVHGRCLYEDSRGVSEALNERGMHHVLLDTLQNSTYWHRMLGERIMMEPILLFAPTGMDYSATESDLKLQVMFMLRFVFVALLYYSCIIFCGAVYVHVLV